jgi:prevent-host-death family protein
MEKQGSVTETMSASEVRQHFASTINKVARDHTRVIVEKNGVPVAAIVPMEYMPRFDSEDAGMTRAAWAVAAMRKAFADVPQEEIEREAEKAITEVRAEMRAERERLAAVTDQ